MGRSGNRRTTDVSFAMSLFLTKKSLEMTLWLKLVEQGWLARDHVLNECPACFVSSSLGCSLVPPWRSRTCWFFYGSGGISCSGRNPGSAAGVSPPWHVTQGVCMLGVLNAEACAWLLPSKACAMSPGRQHRVLAGRLGGVVKVKVRSESWSRESVS